MRVSHEKEIETKAYLDRNKVGTRRQQQSQDSQVEAHIAEPTSNHAQTVLTQIDEVADASFASVSKQVLISQRPEKH